METARDSPIVNTVSQTMNKHISTSLALHEFNMNCALVLLPRNKKMRRDVKITVWRHGRHHRIYTNMGAASLQLAMTHARFACDKIIIGFREGTSRPCSARNENLHSHETSRYISVLTPSDWQEERGFRFKHSTIKNSLDKHCVSYIFKSSISGRK